MSFFQKLIVEDIRRETADCVSVAFTIPPHLREAFRYHQGQNITVRMWMAGTEVRRSYSICSSPLDDELRIAVKQVAGGVFSTFANEQLQTGQELEVLPPTGKFYTELRAENQKHYLAFAAGSGITPVISLVKTTLAVEPQSHFTLVYGNRNRSSIIFREELEALKDRNMQRLALHHILSREQMDVPLNQGRINVSKCAELCPRLIDLSMMDEVFLCGPQEMIFTVRDWLQQQGVDNRKIHFELFHSVDSDAKGASGPKGQSKPEAWESTAAVSQVTVRLDGVSHSFPLSYDGDSVLNAALMEGVDLPFACKGGVCCTCRAKLIEGEVEMDVNYALEADELQAGYVLTCQSHPRTSTVVIDFDSK
ncbi:1,2-phenylacetyl-CoA epoxidase subunit PaaE [Puia dinghuensis]|uniref:Phenylacetic acid degradation protein n=1 Tax=Puia dinghuensis TaxID=1792502 RepID=A0A8J2UG17_9BACT|nr:1,2-phenylacetyl-CoA epoxidase subunit PaaE [Puia dinghuensis]GGB12184.1 phenylacetic acid degradation protein [Puia dinghuensis]